MDLSRHPDPFRAAPQRFPQPCGKCVEAFPLDALRHAPLRGGCSGDFCVLLHPAEQAQRLPHALLSFRGRTPHHPLPLGRRTQKSHHADFRRHYGSPCGCTLHRLHNPEDHRPPRLLVRPRPPWCHQPSHGKSHPRERRDGLGMDAFRPGRCLRMVGCAQKEGRSQ